MALIRVQVSREIAAPPDKVFAAIADFRDARPKWLPQAYSNLSVEKGGVGAGTVVSYKLKVGPRERTYRMEVAVPTPGSMLVEQDSTSSFVSTWTVSARGAATVVNLASQWSGSSGVGGFFERLFAPRGLRRLYDDEMARLARYAMETAR